MGEQDDTAKNLHGIVSTGYDRVADRYGNMANESQWPRLKWLNELLQRLPAKSHVLDVGCGAGVPADVEIAKKHQVVGIDISEEQIRRARQNVPDGEFHCSDVSTKHFEDACFDAIVSFYTIEHIPRRQHSELIERFHKWTSSGGFLLISIEASDYDDVHGLWLDVPMFLSCFAPKKTKKIITSAGYTVIKTAIEKQMEEDREIPYLWILAQKEV
jgi:cyclopropane fatty-acyl-phospholipid synthase-like methyltransferase